MIQPSPDISTNSAIAVTSSDQSPTTKKAKLSKTDAAVSAKAQEVLKQITEQDKGLVWPKSRKANTEPKEISWTKVKASEQECERYLLIESDDDEVVDIQTLVHDRLGFGWKVQS